MNDVVGKITNTDAKLYSRGQNSIYHEQGKTEVCWTRKSGLFMHDKLQEATHQSTRLKVPQFQRYIFCTKWDYQRIALDTLADSSPTIKVRLWLLELSKNLLSLGACWLEVTNHVESTWKCQLYAMNAEIVETHPREGRHPHQSR